MVQVIFAACAVFIAAAVYPSLYGYILCRNLDVLTGGDAGGGQVGIAAGAEQHIAACAEQHIATCDKGGAVLRGG